MFRNGYVMATAITLELEPPFWKSHLSNYASVLCPYGVRKSCALAFGRICFNSSRSLPLPLPLQGFGPRTIPGVALSPEKNHVIKAGFVLLMAMHRFIYPKLPPKTSCCSEGRRRMYLPSQHFGYVLSRWKAQNRLLLHPFLPPFLRLSSPRTPTSASWQRHLVQ